MNVAIQKTLSLLLIMGLGLLIRNKLDKKEHQAALKLLILNVALPAVIFVALMKLHVKPELLVLPVLVLVFNGVFLWLLNYTLPLYDVPKNSPEMRTYMLLIPSLAPGLSCFPFVTEYIGEEALAHGALADIGNKIAVLFFSYMLAMHWFYRLHHQVKHSNHEKLKSLFLGMLNEPINLVMTAALVLLGVGFYFDDFPLFLQDSLSLLSSLMTPLILLFIGIAVVFKWDQFKSIFRLLVFRSGLTFCLSALLICFMPQAGYASLMLAVVFPQSACSFWPFAHMAMVDAMGKKEQVSSSVAVFNNGLAMNILALSLPCSTLIVLSVFSVGPFFTDIAHLLWVGGALIFLSACPSIFAFLFGKGRKNSTDSTIASLAEASLSEAHPVGLEKETVS